MKNLLKNSYSNTNERSNGCFKSTYSQIPEMQRISEMQKEYAIKEQKLLRHLEFYFETGDYKNIQICLLKKKYQSMVMWS